MHSTPALLHVPTHLQPPSTTPPTLAPGPAARPSPDRCPGWAARAAPRAPPGAHTGGREEEQGGGRVGSAQGVGTPATLAAGAMQAQAQLWKPAVHVPGPRSAAPAATGWPPSQGSRGAGCSPGSPRPPPAPVRWWRRLRRQARAGAGGVEAVGDPAAQPGVNPHSAGGLARAGAHSHSQLACLRAGRRGTERARSRAAPWGCGAGVTNRAGGKQGSGTPVDQGGAAWTMPGLSPAAPRSYPAQPASGGQPCMHAPTCTRRGIRRWCRPARARWLSGSRACTRSPARTASCGDKQAHAGRWVRRAGEGCRPVAPRRGAIAGPLCQN